MVSLSRAHSNLSLDGKLLSNVEGFDVRSWEPPAAGILRFDYVSTRRVPQVAKAQRKEVFESFRKEMSNPALSEETRLMMLRSAATMPVRPNRARRAAVFGGAGRGVHECVGALKAARRALARLEHALQQVLPHAAQESSSPPVVG